ncbi:MAG: undecaprenyl/decaprenyl-phosphate alpha-N-acetylglucosaminyl 1-phosphate transferase [Phycisphaerae bacterium]|nr:undecaprenyl/decaprenyl-phosphate alpha-N-acetylglucosaminyl 1-phosphate transferase [Phycisphaerae bacterium]
MMLYVILVSVAVAFVLSALATPVTQRLAVRWGMLDTPGRHKAHAGPVPLLGGCAIFFAILLPSLLALAVASVWARTGGPAWLPKEFAEHISGAAAKAPQALGILAGALVLHVVGLIDDRRNLSPWLKLLAQVLVAVGVVVFAKVRILTAMGGSVSTAASILWLVAVTNAFNFMDNMDGLAAGVGAICAAALLAAAASIGQVFVSAWLCLLLGAQLGFLPYNFHPARTFMGDAGSMILGYFLAVTSCLTTYVPPGRTYYLYGIFVPVVLMAVPLYDAASVILLRIREGRSPMVGDRHHFSHRLLRRGMKVRAAVGTIYLCTACTAISASLLPHVADATGAVLIFAQVLIILMTIALLEWGESRP